ncbi:MAG: histidine kinase [Firmicutes bacterium]|nr:histidine kinase [Bacillota bacterium]
MESYFKRFIDNLEKSQNEGTCVSADNSLPSHSADSKPGGRIAARLAVYDTLRSAPRVLELGADDYEEFINILATKTYQSSKEIGGSMPYTIIREIIENLIHAYFREVVISVLDNGNTVRISDQGPGIKNKEKAFEPGFSTATADMKKYIKGVGSGLPITKETISFLGGAIIIEDNLEQGTVITLKVPSDTDQKNATQKLYRPLSFDINKRQQQVLFLIMEFGSVGPSKIASELGISLSTAYRDLIYLEEKSLVASDEQGKRVLTSAGIGYLEEILSS